MLIFDQTQFKNMSNYIYLMWLYSVVTLVLDRMAISDWLFGSDTQLHVIFPLIFVRFF